MNHQTTSTVLVVKPASFGFNEETAASNAFQLVKNTNETHQQKAAAEFNGVCQLLANNGVNTVILEDTPLPQTPDAIFPNNWLSTHADGRVIIHPMLAHNRRHERRLEDIKDLLGTRGFQIQQVEDISFLEEQDEIVEGTGSLVLDRQNRIAYAVLSPRTTQRAAEHWADLMGFELQLFSAIDINGKSIYHTNVVMTVGRQIAILCTEVIKFEAEKVRICQRLQSTGHTLVEITEAQMNAFAGNALELINQAGEALLAMSDSAYNSLTAAQISTIEKLGIRIIHSDISTIESVGGGSFRCMLAEIFLPQLKLSGLQ